LTGSNPNQDPLYLCSGGQHTVNSRYSELSCCGAPQCNEADCSHGAAKEPTSCFDDMQLSASCGQLSFKAAQETRSSRLREIRGSSPEPVRQLRVEFLDTKRWNVVWPVVVQRLQTSDRQIVSPPFEVAGAVFRLMLKPKEPSKGKGKLGFRHARGRGHVELKCEVGSDITVTDLRLSLTINGKRRGPMSHSFTRAQIACLPQDVEEWDFAGAVSHSSNPHTFAVRLHIESSF